MKRRFFVTILLLFALLSLAACAEKTPTKYPENDFANLLTTDFWSMTESDLNAFLADHRWKSLPDSEGRYLGSFMKETAVLCASYDAEGKVTSLTVEQQFYNEAAKDAAGRSDHSQLREDTAAAFAQFVYAARQTFASYELLISGPKLQGDTEEALQTYFRTTIDMQQATSIHYTDRFEATTSYQEGAYKLLIGGTAELSMQVAFHREDKDSPMQHLATQSLHLCAPNPPIPRPSESEADVWAAYRDATVEETSLPAGFLEADHAELTLHGGSRFFRRMFPQEHLASLLHALPQWVGNPIDAESARVADGSESYQLHLYKDNTLLGLLTFKPQEGWMALFITSDENTTKREADAYYLFSITARQPDFKKMFDLCPRRCLIPTPASLELTSPEGQTVEVPAPEAAALVEQFNRSLRPTSDVYMPNVKDKLKDGGYWILRTISEDGKETEMWLDCFTPVSPEYPFSRLQDEWGIMGFSMPQYMMQKLKELLQSYME